jgi:hypothetical protein
VSLQGTPLAGLGEIARRVYLLGDDLTLVAYTNPGNSLGPGSIAADLVQPPLANGYQPIVLPKAGWTQVNGVATYVHTDGGDPGWLVLPADWGVTVQGAALVYGSTLLHFRDNALPFVATLGKRLTINISNLVGP